MYFWGITFFRNEGIIIILTFLYLYMWKSSFTFSIARPFLTFNKANLLRRFICINNLWVLFILGVSLLQKLMKLLRSSINIKKKTSQNTCIIFGMHAFLCEYATQKNILRYNIAWENAANCNDNVLRCEQCTYPCE